MLGKNKKVVFSVALPAMVVLLIWTVSGISSSVYIDVIESNNLDLTFIPIDNPSNFYSNAEEFLIFINRTYPVADNGLTFHIGHSYSTSSFEKSSPEFLLFNIAKASSISGTFSRTVGVLPQDWFLNYPGINNRRGQAFISRGLIQLPKSALVEAIGIRQIAAHELGHTFGLCEEYNSNAWNKQDVLNFIPGLACPNGDSDNDDMLDSECEPNGCPTSTTGKLLPWNGSSDFVSLTNFMGVDSEDNTWISKENYEYLLAEFQEAPSLAQKAVLVNGRINKTSGDIELFTSYILENIQLSEQSTVGNYSIEILNEIGEVVSNISFISESFETDFNGSVIETNISYFITVMNFTDTDKTVRVRENNLLKNEVNRTENTPSLDIVSNLSDEMFSKEVFEVSWVSLDEDNDTLSYAVLFSADNSGNYTTLEIDYGETSLTLNSSELEECVSCRIKILATDGINTNSSVSDSFSISNAENKFIVRNASGVNKAWLDDLGNLFLRGQCFIQSSCIESTGSFIIRNSSADTVSYINMSGDICISNGDCSDKSASCNPLNSNNFIVRNASGSNMSYIDGEGGLCLTGTLYEAIT